MLYEYRIRRKHDKQKKFYFYFVFIDFWQQQANDVKIERKSQGENIVLFSFFPYRLLLLSPPGGRTITD